MTCASFEGKNGTMAYCFALNGANKAFTRGMLPWEIYEDPATGSAAGSLGAYLVQHGKLAAGANAEHTAGRRDGPAQPNRSGSLANRQETRASLQRRSRKGFRRHNPHLNPAMLIAQLAITRRRSRKRAYLLHDKLLRCRLLSQPKLLFTASRIPFTNAPASSEENFFARSTASFITTLGGVSSARSS